MKTFLNPILFWSKKIKICDKCNLMPNRSDGLSE